MAVARVLDTCQIIHRRTVSFFIFETKDETTEGESSELLSARFSSSVSADCLGVASRLASSSLLAHFCLVFHAREPPVTDP